jgi:hypothetical protein
MTKLMVLVLGFPYFTDNSNNLRTLLEQKNM